MRYLTILFTLFMSSLVFTQTPSINYYGEPPTTDYQIDRFVRLSNGDYRIYGSGYFDGRLNRDICSIDVSENSEVSDVNYIAKDKSQSIFDTAPLPGGNYIVCTSTTFANQLFNDIEISLYDETGALLASIQEGGAFRDFISRLEVDSSGNIYLIIRSATDAHSLGITQDILIKYDVELAE
ncbi:MAG: hypothetical protein AAGJ93_09390, partial [Bacteroidota bacterium]